jgi:hypothetical protein
MNFVILRFCNMTNIGGFMSFYFHLEIIPYLFLFLESFQEYWSQKCKYLSAASQILNYVEKRSLESTFGVSRTEVDV